MNKWMKRRIERSRARCARPMDKKEQAKDFGKSQLSKVNRYKEAKDITAAVSQS